MALVKVSTYINEETLTVKEYEFDKVVLEVNGAGQQVGRNLYGTNLLMRTVDNESYYYMYNGHADVTALINTTTGVVAATYYYDAFGNILEQTGNVNNNITYAGYQWDEETELYYLNARHYDPKIARFLQEDTYRGSINDPLSLNLYSYCANNPITYYDPTGHSWERIKQGANIIKESARIVNQGANWINDKATQAKHYINKAEETWIFTSSRVVTFLYDISPAIYEEQDFGISYEEYIPYYLIDNKGNFTGTNNDAKIAFDIKYMIDEDFRKKADVKYNFYNIEQSSINRQQSAWNIQNTNIEQPSIREGIQATIHFYDPSTNNVNRDFQQGILMGGGSLTGGYSEFNWRLQDNIKKPGTHDGWIGGFTKVSTGNAKGKIGIGNEYVKLSTKGVVDVLTATAQGGLHYKEGFGLGAKIKAAVLSGRLTREFELFDWEIEFGVTGDLLSIGAEVTLGIFPDETGHKNFDARANAGAGLFGGGFVFRATAPR
ncbi:UNVERIFIED_CONTAM: RHS repeat-associated protein [Acetivibrio alkalicellulosi]